MRIKNYKNQEGSALLEALIAILIFAFGVIGLGLFQATLIARDTDSQLRLKASLYASTLAGMASSEPKNAGCYILNSDTSGSCDSSVATEAAEAWAEDYNNNMPGDIEPVVDYTPETSSTDAGQLKITLKWKRDDNDDEHNYVSIAQVGG